MTCNLLVSDFPYNLQLCRHLLDLNLRRPVTSFCVLGVKFIDLTVARVASKVGLLNNSGGGFSKIFETCFVSEMNFQKFLVLKTGPRKRLRKSANTSIIREF